VDDPTIFAHINELAEEEERLFAKAGEEGGLDPSEVERLDAIKIQLDQAYDLLHQREARRAAGLDPDQASERPAAVVEGYQQ
jgi:hypothetical protein